MIWGSGGCIYKRSLAEFGVGDGLRCLLCFLGGKWGKNAVARKVHMNFGNFRDNGPDAMSVGFHVTTFLPFFFHRPKVSSKSMCQMGLLDMKRQIEVQVDLDCLGVGGHQSRHGWERESNNVLGGAPGELGADVDQREGGDDGE